PFVYDAVISCGFCFQCAALYWIWSWAWGEKPDRVRLLLGSICQGLALGARVHLILACPLLLLAYWHICRGGQRPFSRDGLQTLACLLLPVGTWLFLLGLYNYARFHSWTEFGTRYQLAGVYVQKWDLFDYRSILPGLHAYSLVPYDVDGRYPFLHPHMVQAWWL